jgi:hypothetical protein
MRHEAHDCRCPLCKSVFNTNGFLVWHHSADPVWHCPICEHIATYGAADEKCPLCSDDKVLFTVLWDEYAARPEDAVLVSLTACPQCFPEKKWRKRKRPVGFWLSAFTLKQIKNHAREMNRAPRPPVKELGREWTWKDEKKLQPCVSLPGDIPKPWQQGEGYLKLCSVRAKDCDGERLEPGKFWKVEKSKQKAHWHNDGVEEKMLRLAASLTPQDNADSWVESLGGIKEEPSREHTYKSKGLDGVWRTFTTSHIPCYQIGRLEESDTFIRCHGRAKEATQHPEWKEWKKILGPVDNRRGSRAGGVALTTLKHRKLISGVPDDDVAFCINYLVRKSYHKYLDEELTRKELGKHYGEPRTEEHREITRQRETQRDATAYAKELADVAYPDGFDSLGEGVRCDDWTDKRVGDAHGMLEKTVERHRKELYRVCRHWKWLRDATWKRLQRVQPNDLTGFAEEAVLWADASEGLKKRVALSLEGAKKSGLQVVEK